MQDNNFEEKPVPLALAGGGFIGGGGFYFDGGDFPPKSFKRFYKDKRLYKDKKLYKEIEVAPWYGKAEDTARAVNKYLSKQIQRHFEFVKKDINFNGAFVIVTKNRKNRVKETRKFYVE